jgi:hypothetical protein
MLKCSKNQYLTEKANHTKEINNEKEKIDFNTQNATAVNINTLNLN